MTYVVSMQLTVGIKNLVFFKNKKSSVELCP